MASFLLVHSMFHGGWSYDKLRPVLQARGHSVLAPDLAGCGADQTSAGAVTLDGWARQIAALAARQETPVILVGHSRGGIVITQAAEQAPEHVAALVYLTAMMLPNNKAAVDIAGIMAEQGFGPPGEMFETRLSPDGMSIMPPSNAATLFYGECTPDVREWAMPLLCNEPAGPIMTRVATTPERYGRIPKVYIETTEDLVLPISAQRAMIAAVRPDKVISMRTGHMPIYTDVDELADVLEEISKNFAS